MVTTRNRSILVRAYAVDHSRDEVAWFAMKLFGWDADFSESDHPRDERGRFTSGGGNSSLSSSEKHGTISAETKAKGKRLTKKPSAKPVTGKEMAVLTHAVDTFVRPNLKEPWIVNYEYGGHRYTLDVTEDGFEVLAKQGLDESSAYYDKKYSRWKDGRESRPVGKALRKVR